MWPTLSRPVDFPPVPLAPQCSYGVQIHNALAAIIKRIFRNYQTYLSKLSAFDATPTVRNWPGVVSWSSLGEAASLFNVRTLDTVSWRKSALLASAPGWIAKLFLLQSVVYSYGKLNLLFLKSSGWVNWYIWVKNALHSRKDQQTLDSKKRQKSRRRQKVHHIPWEVRPRIKNPFPRIGRTVHFTLRLRIEFVVHFSF